MIIAVYCSAKDTIPNQYKHLGEQLGKWIAAKGHTLLYGGATGGLMSITSQTVKENGGKIIGVIPSRIIKSGRKASHCDELFEVGDMCERKRLMREKADCFVCLPGSYGTLDEMFDVIASGTIGEHKKKIYVLNYEGFYDGLLQEIHHMKSLGFLPQVEHYQPVIIDSIEQLIEKLEINN